MRDEHFDIDAFPMHHGDGNYGLKHKRKTKIHPHKYFSQRIMNHDKRWRKDSSYVFVAQQYVERHAIERNIGVSMTKGKMKKDAWNQLIALGVLYYSDRERYGIFVERISDRLC